MSEGTRDRKQEGSLRDVIEAHSERVDLKELSRHNRSGRVLNLSVLERIMTDAIASLLLRGTADPLLERAAFQEQTRQELRKLLESQGEALKARESLELQVSHLRKELEQTSSRLRWEKEREGAPVELSAESVARLKDKVREELKRMLVERELESRVMAVLELSIEEERTLLSTQRSSGRAADIEQLERRVQKLSKALQETEGALQVALSGGEADAGVKSIYASVQGLSADSANAQRKKELIKLVFVNNLRLRKREVTAEDLQGIPAELVIAATVEEPVEPLTVEPLTDETAF